MKNLKNYKGKERERESYIASHILLDFEGF
jgi:hypothetical protein